MPTERPAHPEPHPTPRGILCPYCGTVSSADPKRCERCGGFFDPLSRQATQNAMGPWFIRDPAAPFRPGCSFETVRDLIRRGKVTRETILRGPSTRQYWNFASRTPGIANLLGLCHNCHVPVKSDDFSCAACGAVFSPETDRQHMGLAPVHLLPGQASPEIIAAASVDQARSRPPAQRRPSAARAASPTVVPPPRASSGVRAVVLVLVGMALIGAVGVGVVRFVLPMFNEPSPASASHPAPAPDPGRPSPETKASRDAAASPEPPPTQEPAPSTPAPAPTPDPATTPVEVPKLAADAGLLAALTGPGLDAPAVLKQIEDLAAEGKLKDPQAWVALVQDRAACARLRVLP